jgi:histidine ammonia-lyase
MLMPHTKNAEPVIIGERNLSLDEIIEIAKGNVTIEISSHPDFTKRMKQSQKILLHSLETDLPVYGVTTGFGKSCGKRMSAVETIKNGTNLIRFHGCGTGDPIGIEEVRAAMLCRILCLSKGYSGVSIALLEQLAAFLNNQITPVVPSEGSVGASGDLTPMSYVAAALIGEREVFYKGERISASSAISDAGIEPYTFGPKEPLAIINGTAIMTGIAILAIHKAQRIMDAATCATALTVHAIQGNAHHFHPVISTAKPHPGQKYIANQIFALLKKVDSKTKLSNDAPETFQDPYSVRCAPQIVGVLYDALIWVKDWVEIEANNSNDNPICDPDSGRIFMGGNFYGGHIVFAMDALKAALASIADMSDRQIALMVNPNVNRGLPADLVRVNDTERPYHNGFKAMSISSSALAAEALKGTMPAASFSRSTESHNQDKVSMGTIAARDALRLCQLVKRTVAIHLLTSAQAVEIREKIEDRPLVGEIVQGIRSLAPAVMEDRPMDIDINKVAQAIVNSNIFDFDNKI